MWPSLSLDKTYLQYILKRYAKEQNSIKVHMHIFRLTHTHTLNKIVRYIQNVQKTHGYTLLVE